MNTLEQQSERFSTLPPDFQQVISSFDYDHRLQNINKKFNLHIDQLVELEKGLADVVFGDLKSLELTNFIEHNLRLPRDKASEIAIEINTTILIPLREKIKNTQSESGGDIL